MAQKPNRYQLLDSLRGLAAIWVVAFHLLAEFREQYGQVLNHLIKTGNLGVQIFFVIGGYGISASVQRKFQQGSSSYTFVARRMSRIFFTYLFCLLFAALVIPLLCALLSAVKSGEVVVHFFPYSAIEWIQLITLTKVFSAQSWELNRAFLPINGAFWYIAILVQIYLVVSFGAIRRRFFYVLVSTTTLLGLISCLPSVKELLPIGLFLPFFPEFAVGIVLHHLLSHNIFFPITSARTKLFYCLSLVGFLALATLVLFFWFSTLSFAVIVGVFLWFLWPLDSVLSSSRPFRFFAFVGSFSYSLYMMHFPLWPLFDILVRNSIPLPLSVSTPLLLIPLVVIFSFIWFLFFEKPGSWLGTIRALGSPWHTLKNGFTRSRLKKPIE